MPKFRCVIHGSFRRHFDEIKRVHNLFSAAGIEVLAPSFSEIKTIENGFAILESDQSTDQRLIELKYLHNLKQLGESGFSYFVNPAGYIGKSASYELGIAQVSNIPCFFKEKLDDHPAYLHNNSVWKPELLAEYILENWELPGHKIKRNEKQIHRMWEGLMVPGSVVAVGAIIEHNSKKSRDEKEVLLVKTHKWGHRFSIVGGKVRRNEKMDEGLRREVREETNLKGEIGGHIATFDQIKNSGYYRVVQHIFIDKVFRTESKKVSLNEEAQEYLWIPPSIALKELDIEPNAKHTLELYTKLK